MVITVVIVITVCIVVPNAKLLGFRSNPLGPNCKEKKKQEKSSADVIFHLIFLILISGHKESQDEVDGFLSFL